MTTRALQIECLLTPLYDYRNGSLCSAYTAYFYAAGTSTAKNVWTEKEKTNPYTSRTIGSDGTIQVYGDGVYKIVIKDGDGTAVYTWDNVKIQYPNISVVSKAATYTATIEDDYILVDTSGGNVTINLYAAANFTHPVCVKNIGANNMIFDPDGAELIEGAATYTVTTEGAAVWLFSNGSAWYVGNHTAVSATTLNSGATVNAFANEGIHILDSDGTHDLILKVGSDLTADRILTITTGDAARTITLSGSPTLADWFDQAVKAASSPTFLNLIVSTILTLANEGLHILDTNASHDLIIKPGSDLTADRILTITTGDAARTITLTGNLTANQAVDTTASPTVVNITLSGKTQHRIPVFGASGVFSELAAMTNGQIVVGNTGAAPAPVTVGGDATLAANGTLTISGLGLSKLAAGSPLVEMPIDATHVTLTTASDSYVALATHYVYIPADATTLILRVGMSRDSSGTATVRLAVNGAGVTGGEVTEAGATIAWKTATAADVSGLTGYYDLAIQGKGVSGGGCKVYAYLVTWT